MKSFFFLALILILGFKFYSIEFLATLLVLSFLIFFHELGHFLAAKSLKVKVEIFSIGFGKSLVEREFNDTKYRLSALPFGGYVKLKGQDDLNGQNLDKDSYTSLGSIKKIYILLAGPFFNFLLAFLLYVIVANIGLEKFAPTIGHIAQNSAAQEAGLKINDKILAINENKIQSFDEISTHLSLTPLKILIERNAEKKEFTVSPKVAKGYNDFGQIISKPYLGISPNGEKILITHTGLESLKYAFHESFKASMLIVKGIGKLLSNEIEAKNLGGILSITELTSRAAESSLSLLLSISALISINLGILNLLPIPMLDGGHIAFNLYELLFRRKISQNAFKYLSYLGLALLLSLMLFATYNDLVKLFK